MLILMRYLAIHQQTGCDVLAMPRIDVGRLGGWCWEESCCMSFSDNDVDDAHTAPPVCRPNRFGLRLICRQGGLDVLNFSPTDRVDL